MTTPLNGVKHPMRYSEQSYITRGALLSLALVLAQAPVALAQSKHTLPLFIPASHPTLQGFVRIINLSERAGTVTIHAIDDSGRRFDPISLSLDAKATRHFNSDELRDGAPEKGLTEGIGDGDGNWRLELETKLDIEPLAYTRPRGDGFLTSTHDVVTVRESMRWHVPMFNPGSNLSQHSWLRVVNTSDVDTEVVIQGLDDLGTPPPEGEVRFTLPADAAGMLSAKALEEGSSGSDFEFQGSFGDGTGKWQLFVAAGHPIQVMSLLLSQSGNLTNLSTSTSGRVFDLSRYAPTNQAAFDEFHVGKRLILGHLRASDYIDFVSPGRALLADNQNNGVGDDEIDYSYENTGQNSGRIDIPGPVGLHFKYELAFDSQTMGSYDYFVNDGRTGESRWHLESIVEDAETLHSLACSQPVENDSAWNISHLYDCEDRTIFVPYQLWTGAQWDGNKDAPCMHPADSVFFVNGVSGKTIKGPTEWFNPSTGNTETIWERNNLDGKKTQYFVCHERGIGRVYDRRRQEEGNSRPNDGRCKFPGGYGWPVFERGFCTISAIEIIRIALNHDHELSGLEFKWWYQSSSGGYVLDHIYRYVPNVGSTHAWAQTR